MAPSGRRVADQGKWRACEVEQCIRYRVEVLRRGAERREYVAMVDGEMIRRWLFYRVRSLAARGEVFVTRVEPRSLHDLLLALIG